jgi:putative transcriptional regulator
MLKEESDMARPKKGTAPLNELEKDLLEAAQEMLAHMRGEIELPTYYYTPPENVDVKQIRSNLHLTQKQFAHFIGASVHAVRHWENGRRKPDGTARTLLRVLQSNPCAVLDALGQPHKAIFTSSLAASAAPL